MRRKTLAALAIALTMALLEPMAIAADFDFTPSGAHTDNYVYDGTTYTTSDADNSITGDTSNNFTFMNSDATLTVTGVTSTGGIYANGNLTIDGGGSLAAANRGSGPGIDVNGTLTVDGGTAVSGTNDEYISGVSAENINVVNGTLSGTSGVSNASDRHGIQAGSITYGGVTYTQDAFDAATPGNKVPASTTGAGTASISTTPVIDDDEKEDADNTKSVRLQVGGTQILNVSSTGTIITAYITEDVEAIAKALLLRTTVSGWIDGVNMTKAILYLRADLLPVNIMAHLMSSGATASAINGVAYIVVDTSSFNPDPELKKYDL